MGVATGDRGIGVGDTGERSGRAGSRNTKVPAGSLPGTRAGAGAGAGEAPREKNCWLLVAVLGMEGTGARPVPGLGSRNTKGVKPRDWGGRGRPRWSPTSLIGRFCFTSASCCLRNTKGEPPSTPEPPGNTVPVTN